MTAHEFQGRGYTRQPFIDNVQIEDDLSYTIFDISTHQINSSTFQNLTLNQNRTPQSIKVQNCTIAKLIVNLVDNNTIEITDSSIEAIVVRGRRNATIQIQKSKNKRIEVTVQDDGTSKVHLKELHSQEFVLDQEGQNIVSINLDRVTFQRQLKQNNEQTPNMVFNIHVSKIQISSSFIDWMYFSDSVSHLKSEKSQIGQVTGVVKKIESSKDSIASIETELTTEVMINGSSIKNLDITTETFEKINTGKYVNEDKSSVDTEIGYLKLIQPKVIGYTIRFSNTRFGTLILSKIKTSKAPVNDSIKELSFEFVTVNTRLEMENCVFDERATFSRVDLYNCVLSIDHCSIINAKYYSIRWPDKYTLEEIVSDTSRPLGERLDQLWNLRETYRQLKVISSINQNVIDSKQFLKNEVRIYYRVVKNKTFSSFRSIFSPNFWDWAVLGTNKLFSDFGESVWIPLAWLLGVNYLLFLFFIDDFNLIPVQWNRLSEFNYGETRRALGIFLNLLNPVHSFKVEEVNLFGTADFFMRVLSSYFLFYFVRATRKFHF